MKPSLRRVTSGTAMQKRSGISKGSVMGRQPLLDRQTTIARLDRGNSQVHHAGRWHPAHPQYHTPPYPPSTRASRS
jgi:hypothetical protein